MGAAEGLEELLSLDHVRQMTGMGTTFIYGEIKAGRFPRSIRIGRRALWIQSEVQGCSRSRRIDLCRWMGKRAGSEGCRNEKAPISRSFLQRLAERVGFEPTEGLTLRRFSRPVP